jgi:hypothetical protein
VHYREDHHIILVPGRTLVLPHGRVMRWIGCCQATHSFASAGLRCFALATRYSTVLNAGNTMQGEQLNKDFFFLVVKCIKNYHFTFS